MTLRFKRSRCFTMGGSAFLTILLATSCAPRSSECSKALQGVLSDFMYAGVLKAESLQNSSLRPDRLESLATFESGRKYVFFHSAPVDNAELATTTLPTRLRAAGFQVQGPSSAGELAYPDLGGPLFSIRLSKPGCSGRVYNVVDERIPNDTGLAIKWASEAYILELDAR
jgi:hypothetical protein